MFAGKLVGLLAWHLLLTAIPGAACSLYAARRGVRSIPVLLAIFLAGSGIVGLGGFWAFYADTNVGMAYAILVLVLGVASIVSSLWGGRVDRSILLGLAVPLGLWALGCAFLLLFGYVHGGVDHAILVTGNRFSHPLPTDSRIPRFYVEWFYAHGHHGTPPIYPGEWHFSDRPPLQVGYELTQRPFGTDRAGLNYEIVGLVLQQLWIVGLWALLLATRINRVSRGLVMVVVLTSSLVFVNAFFVWPKLLPAAMLLAAAAIVMTPLWDDLRRNLWAAALVAALCGVAMMGHGSSVFGIIPLALLAIYRGLPSWRWVGVGVAVGIVIIGSWSAYQKWGDPPGNRLTKWTLAGVFEIDGRGTRETIEDAYSEAGFSGAVDNHVENFETMIGTTFGIEAFEDMVSFDSLRQSVVDAREISFYFIVPSLGLLLLGPLAMAARWRRRDRGDPQWNFALTCIALFVGGSVIWGILVFGGQTDLTYVHISSYLLPILAMAGCVTGLRAAFPRFAVWYLAIAAFLSFCLYVPVLEPLPHTAYSPLPAVLVALAGLAFIAIAIGGPRPPLPALRRRPSRSDQLAQAPQA